MKNIKIKQNLLYLPIAITVVLVSGCQDYLEREPLDTGTEAIFYQTPGQFTQAANGLYVSLEGWKNNDNTNIGGTRVDNGTDLSGFTQSGTETTVETDERHWDKPYSYIRRCNILLEKAKEYPGKPEEIAASVGAANFFRAYNYFFMLQYYGGVPIVDHVPDVSDPVLTAPRNSRYEVVNFIIGDLREAVAKLPKEKSIAATDKGKISQEAAKAFLARVLLYEATWEKYVPTIGYDLDGDGTSAGAGTAKPSGYPDITAMLTEAKQMAGEVIDEAETGTFALWDECDTLSYYYLFNIDDKGGNISNFKNVGKSTNKEFILSAKYEFSIRNGGFNLAHCVSTNQLAHMSTYLGELFLCRNGLPIHVSNTASQPTNAKRSDNPDYLGMEHFYDEYRNRDYRFIGCTKMPDRPSWGSKSDYNTQHKTNDGKPYPDATYPEVPYNPQDPAFSQKTTIYVPTLLGGGTHNDYLNRKFLPEGALRSDNQESPDYPIIRLAEVYLIYAEAACEIGGGTISDADLDKSINKLRDRARVAHLSNALIAGKWDCGWWDHQQNKTICKPMNMLDEIRRERTVELFAEGFREDDLKRWGMMHFAMTGQKLGRYVYGTEYMTATANDANFHGQPCYQETKYPLDYGVYKGGGSISADPDYGRSIATRSDNLLYLPKHYLHPLPLTQIRLNPNMTQNPDW